MGVVTDTVTNEAGQPASGVAVQIQILSNTLGILTEVFVTGPTEFQIYPSFTVHTDIAGQWTAHLYRNDHIYPANTVYRITTGAQIAYCRMPDDGSYSLYDILYTP